MCKSCKVDTGRFSSVVSTSPQCSVAGLPYPSDRDITSSCGDAELSLWVFEAILELCHGYNTLPPTSSWSRTHKRRVRPPPHKPDPKISTIQAIKTARPRMLDIRRTHIFSIRVPSTHPLFVSPHPHPLSPFPLRVPKTPAPSPTAD